MRWDGGVDSDSSYDSYVNDDSGAITLDSAAWPPEPTFNLPSPQAWLRAYLAAVDSYFAGNHGPHAIGRGPNALGRERSIHGDHESGMHAAIIDLVHAEGAGGGPSSNASGPQVTNLASRGTPRQSQSDAPSGPATQPPATEPAASASSLDAPALVGGFFDGFMTGLGGVVDAVASVGEEVVNVVQGVLNTPVGSFGKTKITLWDLFDPSPSTTTLPGMPIRPKGNPDPNGSYTLTASQGNAILDGIQLVLDIAGLLPVVGEPADAISGLISLARGATLARR